MPGKTAVSMSGYFLFLFITTAVYAADDGMKGPVDAAVRNNTAYYAIQVGSYQDSKEADKQVAILKTYGLAAVSSHEAVEGKGMWYRIYAGRFSTRQEAITIASSLKADGIISGYWIRALKDPDSLPVSPKPDATEQAIAQKAAPPVPKEVPTPEENHIEAQVSSEDQAISQPSQLQAENQSPNLVIPYKEYENQPAEDTLDEAPAPEIGYDDESRFAVALRPGVVYFQNLDEFTISSPTLNWSFVKKYPTMAIVPSFNLNQSFSLEGSLGKILDAKFDSWYATLGPNFRLITSSNEDLINLCPYLRGALVVGKMNWDEVPGNFDTRIGWELGIGTDVIAVRSSLKLGLDVSYRNIEIGYNAPSDSDITSSQSKMDFSSISFTSFLNYYF